MKKLSAPIETLIVDLSKQQDKIDFDNSSSSPEFILGWAKLERIGECIYRVYNSFNHKMPSAYMITFFPIQNANLAVNQGI